ncbi:MAG: TMEM43 family protein, partial [Planctomycetota bacterium]
MDRFVEVTRTGYGGNIMKSITGAFVGLIIFLLAFPLLWWNEGRTNWAEVARTAKVAPTDKTDSALDQTLVSVSGPVKSEEEIGDPEFLRPGPWVSLTRHVEMYSWHEKKDSKEDKEVGGSSTKTTTYTYTKSWSHSPQGSSGFKDRSGHENPTLTLKGSESAVTNATIGAWSFSPRDAELPTAERLSLNDGMLAVSNSDAAITSSLRRRPPVVESDYLFLGNGRLADPQVGDVRVSFTALRRDTNVTLFGRVFNGTVVAHVTPQNEKFFRLLKGSRDEAIATLQFEHSVT